MTTKIEIGLGDDYLCVSGTLNELVSRSTCVFSGQASAIYYCFPSRNSYQERMCCACCGCRGLGGLYFGRMIALASCTGAGIGSQPDVEVDWSTSDSPAGYACWCRWVTVSESDCGSLQMLNESGNVHAGHLPGHRDALRAHSDHDFLDINRDHAWEETRLYPHPVRILCDHQRLYRLYRHPVVLRANCPLDRHGSHGPVVPVLVLGCRLARDLDAPALHDGCGPPRQLYLHRSWPCQLCAEGDFSRVQRTFSCMSSSFLASRSSLGTPCGLD